MGLVCAGVSRHRSLGSCWCGCIKTASSGVDVPEHKVESFGSRIPRTTVSETHSCVTRINVMSREREREVTMTVVYSLNTPATPFFLLTNNFVNFFTMQILSGYINLCSGLYPLWAQAVCNAAPPRDGDVCSCLNVTAAGTIGGCAGAACSSWKHTFLRSKYCHDPVASRHRSAPVSKLWYAYRYWYDPWYTSTLTKY